MSKSKKDFRKLINEKVLIRDGYACKVCGDKNSPLNCHHITDSFEMPHKGYVMENLITLCDKHNGCHWKAEKFHISGNKQAIEGYHPDELYKLIGSSYELAFEKSEQLK